MQSLAIFEVLKIPAFRYLWLAQVLSQVAVNMALFLFGIMIYEATRSNAAVSILFFAFGVPATVFGVISGVVVDRLNKRQILFATTILRAVLLLFLLGARSSLMVVYGLIALLSLLSQFFVPAQAALIPRLVPERLLIPANSLFILSFYSALIGGFVAGGPILALLGEVAVVIFLSSMFLVAALLVLLVPPKVASQAQKFELNLAQLAHDIKTGVTFIRQVDLVAYAMTLLVIAQVLIAIFATLGPGFVDQGLSLRTTDSSVLLLGPAALGLIVGVLLIGQIGSRFRKRTLIEMGIFLSGVLLLLVAVTVESHDYRLVLSLLRNVPVIPLPSFILAIVMTCFFLLGFANSLIDVSCNTVLQEYTTDQIRGRIYGILSSLISGVALVPVVVSGILADVVGIDRVIFLMGGMLILFGLYVRLSKRAR